MRILKINNAAWNLINKNTKNIPAQKNYTQPQAHDRVSFGAKNKIDIEEIKKIQQSDSLDYNNVSTSKAINILKFFGFEALAEGQMDGVKLASPFSGFILYTKGKKVAPNSMEKIYRAIKHAPETNGELLLTNSEAEYQEKKGLFIARTSAKVGNNNTYRQYLEAFSDETPEENKVLKPEKNSSSYKIPAAQSLELRQKISDLSDWIAMLKEEQNRFSRGSNKEDFEKLFEEITKIERALNKIQKEIKGEFEETDIIERLDSIIKQAELLYNTYSQKEIKIAEQNSDNIPDSVQISPKRQTGGRIVRKKDNKDRTDIPRQLKARIKAFSDTFSPSGKVNYQVYQMFLNTFPKKIIEDYGKNKLDDEVMFFLVFENFISSPEYKKLAAIVNYVKGLNLSDKKAEIKLNSFMNPLNDEEKEQVKNEILKYIPAYFLRIGINNSRQIVYFNDKDEQRFMDLLSKQTKEYTILLDKNADEKIRKILLCQFLEGFDELQESSIIFFLSEIFEVNERIDEIERQIFEESKQEAKETIIKDNVRGVIRSPKEIEDLAMDIAIRSGEKSKKRVVEEIGYERLVNLVKMGYTQYCSYIEN